MEFYFIVMLAGILLAYLLSWIMIYIEINYIRNGPDDNIEIRVHMLKKTVLYNLQIPVMELTPKEIGIWLESEMATTQRHAPRNTKDQGGLRQTMKGILYYTKFYNIFMNKIIHSLRCEKFCWKTSYGTEDPELTALIYGVICTITGIGITALSKRFILCERPVISITPFWGQRKLTVDFRCIFSIRLGNVISAYMGVLKITHKEATSGG